MKQEAHSRVRSFAVALAPLVAGAVVISAIVQRFHLHVSVTLPFVIGVLVMFFTFLYAPLAVAQVLLLLSHRRHGRAPPSGSQDVTPPFPGRKVVVVVTTNGENPTVVETVVRTVAGYKLPVELFVLREASDRFAYSAPTLTVPAEYVTPRGSRHKLRALHYGISRLHEMGYGAETYICHLDDDSIPSKPYLAHIFRMKEEAGQGCLRLREHGHHLFSTLADMVRVSDCDAFCSYFNRKHAPKAVHGEGLVIRADVEYAIGWDFATFGADDFIMGQTLVLKGYSFGYIPHHVFVAPPLSARDFFRQRRRWMISILWARHLLARLNRRNLYWILYRYSVGWAGFLGMFLVVVGAVVHPSLPWFVEAMAAFNLVSYFAFYQYGVAQTAKRYALPMLLLQFPVAMYEGATLVYSALFPPNRSVFDVIRKA